jgi:hypothetical protein
MSKEFKRYALALTSNRLARQLGFELYSLKKSTRDVNQLLFRRNPIWVIFLNSTRSKEEILSEICILKFPSGKSFQMLDSIRNEIENPIYFNGKQVYLNKRGYFCLNNHCGTLIPENSWMDFSIQYFEY